MSVNKKRLIERAKKAAIGAGALIMNYYQYPSHVNQRAKADKTPVTDADIEAHHYIEQQLAAQGQGIPLLSEEHMLPSFHERQKWHSYWLIDPLDGTKEFLRQKPEFVVCIALIEQHYPTIGVIYHPVSQTLYFAQQGEGAYMLQGRHKKRISAKKRRTGPTKVYCSPRHRLHPKAKDLLPSNCQYIPVGSALKFCYVAQGLGDIYPGFGRTAEWDVAAGQCVLEQAGGAVVDEKGNRFSYNYKPSLTTQPFWAVSDPALITILTNGHTGENDDNATT